MKKLVGLLITWLAFHHCAWSQVDTAYVFNPTAPYGTLDIRIAKSPTWYYYLQENKTFSFRESSPGVRTNTYRDMTSWESSPYTQGNLREKNGSADNFIMNYRLLFPSGYNPSYAEGYPLIIMMHGAGERGNCWDTNCYWADRNWNPYSNIPAAPTTSTHQLLNNDHNLLHGGLVHLNARNLAGTRLPNDPAMPARAFPGFILFAQNLNGWNPNSVQDAIRIVRLITKKYKIDQNRIYVHGLSNGGEATYEIIKRAPWLFAAALPMSAITDANSINNGLAPKIATIPLWIFQGGVDTNPPPSKTEFYVKKFREAGGIVRYTKYPTIGHGVWNTAYNEPDFFTWILQQNRANIHVFSGIAAVCKTTNQGVKLELPEGHLAYQWERDGVIIPEATAATFVANSPGIYRGRFSRVSNAPSEDQWNRWSDPKTVTEQNPAQPQITQKGSVLLRDLNFNNNAYLSSASSAAHYYWYKNGTLVDIAGSNQDDTTRYATFQAGLCADPTPCPGNGQYTLVTAGLDNCPSPPSEPKYVFFENQAPININAPATFTGSATSASVATLNWTDNSDNEGGFEIWRRKATGPSTFTIWTMSVLTGPDVTSFNDTGLEPNSTYQYKIRAVSNTGRSNYTPSASYIFLVINTSGDTQPPSAPSGLVATSTAIREITLSWQPSTDNTGIREYYIFHGSDTVKTGSPVTSFRLSNLTLNKVYNFTVKAVDIANNLSEASNTASANTYVSGLYYEHSTGAWTDLDQINWSMAEFKGKVDNFTLAPRTQEDFFNFEYEGYLYITRSGTYRFRITSDDGSRLTLNNAVIADNDGVHGSVTVTSLDQNLQAGPHLINVKFFEYTSGQSLSVQYRGRDTGTLWKTIPNSALKSGTPPSGTSSSSSLAGIASLEEAPTHNPFDATIYPNPAFSGDEMKVIVNAMPDAPVQINLHNMFGKVFYDKTFEPAEVIDGAVVNADERLPVGIYTLTVTQGNNTLKKRVIIKN